MRLKDKNNKMMYKFRLIALVLFFLSLSELNKCYAQSNYINQESLNSVYLEDNPIVSADGNKIFFNSTRIYPERYWAKYKKIDLRYDYDIYFSRKADGKWIAPENLGELINTNEDDVVVSINPEGNVVYYLSFKEGWRTMGGPFFRAEYHGKDWSNITAMGGGLSTFFKTYPGVIYVAGASISAKGKEFYFSTNICSESGVFDIWVTYFRNGEWSYPKNLGPRINAIGANNTFPYMSYDERTLFFSSNGFGGYGRKEILFSILRDDGWSLPLNVGNTVNTESDEYQMTLPGAGKPIYLVSDRAGGQGGADIYIATLLPEVSPTLSTIVTGRVFDPQSRPMGAEIIVEDLTRPDEAYTTWSNSQTGDYTVLLNPGGSYRLYFQKPGYFFASSEYDISNKKVSEGKNSKKIVKDEVISPLNKGMSYLSNFVFFETGQSTLRDESRVELDRIVKLMKDNPSIFLEITGYTDNTGTVEFNQRLSEDRAKSVRNYLIETGNINPGRITTAGMGQALPIADNTTEEGRQKNRRTEFKFREK